jgi:hypothetical protein
VSTRWLGDRGENNLSWTSVESTTVVLLDGIEQVNQVDLRDIVLRGDIGLESSIPPEWQRKREAQIEGCYIRPT